MRDSEEIDRRGLLRGGCILGASAWLSGCMHSPAPKAKGPEKGEAEPEVTANEDLMREHGVLRRVLLVYDEVERRLRAGAEVPQDVVQPAARLIRTFVEDYHERMEERFVFPLFANDPVLGALVAVLRRQHDAGRKVTDHILSLSSPSMLGDMAKRRELADQLHAFNRMYRPHAAREDTVLFPALHEVLDPSRYRALGETLEEEEHRILRGGGFEHAVEQIAGIEQSLGIENLAQFTPT